MTRTDLFRLIVGSMIIASVLLAHFVTPWACVLTLFIGANLFQSAFTRVCSLASILRRTRLPAEREV